MSKLVLLYTGPLMGLLLVALLCTGNLLSSNPVIIACQAAGLALVIYARVSFGRQKFHISARPAEGPLLRRGPYRFIRHPMYAGVSLLLLATVIGHLSVSTAPIGLLVLILIPWRVHLEEGLLGTAYPDYAEYASGTKKIIPFVY